MAFLDPRVYYELGLILMMICEFLMLFLLAYAYWVSLPKLKRKKDEELEYEIQIRTDDYSTKLHNALMAEQDKRWQREQRENAEWDARNAEKKRLRKEARERERDRWGLGDINKLMSQANELSQAFLDFFSIYHRVSASAWIDGPPSA